MSRYTVLMFSEDLHLYQRLGRFLEYQDVLVLRADTGQALEEALHSREVDLILARVHRHGGEELAVLQRVKSLHTQVRMILCNREGETAFPLEAYQLEADDYLLMPCKAAELWRRVSACLKRSPRRTNAPAAASRLASINGAIVDKLASVFHYFRYHLDSSVAALKPMANAPASRPNEKLRAKIYEVSARLEVLQEMTDGFLRGISGVEAPTG